MVVADFYTKCTQYQNFEIWEVADMDSFFKGNSVLTEIFKDEYKMPVSELISRRDEIPHSNLKIMENLLDRIGDKHFHLFALGDENHMQLINMQNLKIMDFGMDISKIKDNCVYIMIMDKVGN